MFEVVLKIIEIFLEIIEFAAWITLIIYIIKGGNK